MIRHEYNLELARRRAAVLLYVEHHPGTTVRHISMAVFGGSGKRQTSERGLAQRILYELESASAVRREHGHLPPIGHRTPDRWYAVT